MSVESGLIVAADVVRDTNDRQQLHPMVNQVVHNVGTPQHVLVDTDYENLSQLQTVEAATGTQVLCPPRRSDGAVESVAALGTAPTPLAHVPCAPTVEGRQELRTSGSSRWRRSVASR